MDSDLKKRITGYHSPMDVGKEWERLEKKRKEKRRKYVLFWIMLLGGSGSIAAVWLQQNLSTHEAKHASEITTYAANAVNQSSEEEICPEPSSQVVAHTDLEQKSILENSAPQLAKKQNPFKQKSNPFDQTEDFSRLSNRAATIEQTSQQVQISDSYTAHLADQPKSGKQDEAPEIIAADRGLDEVSSIPSKYTNVLLKETYELNEISPAISPAPPQKLRFIIAISGLHTGKVPISDVWAEEFQIPHLNMGSSSFTTSLGMGKSVGDRFFMSGGIFYNQTQDHLKASYEFTEDVILPGQLVRISYLENGDYIETYDNAQAQVTRRLNLDVRNHFHTLGLQAGISYQNGRRWELAAGVKLPVYQNYALVSLDANLKPLDIRGINWFGTNGLQADLGISYQFWAIRGTRMYLDAGMTHLQRELNFGGAESKTGLWTPQLGLHFKM